MPATMKALRKMQPARGLQMDTLAVPATGPTDVLVRVKAASICGTDLHIYGWDRWSQGRIKPPLTLGHEFCGNVERVGEEVTAVKPGDFVSAEMHINCGHCRQCRLGQAHICQNLRIIGIDQDGAFADFVRIPASNIIKLDPGIPEHDCGANRFGDGMRADWIDVDCGGESLRKFYRICDGDERGAARHGQENGRGRGD